MFYWKSITYCRILFQVRLIKVSFIELTYAMVKINCILSLSHFCLERLRFSYNFPNFRSVFLWDFYHFQHVFWAFGQIFQNFSLQVILTEQISLWQALECWHVCCFRNKSFIIDVQLGCMQAFKNIEIFKVKLRWDKSSQLLQHVALLV